MDSLEYIPFNIGRLILKHCYNNRALTLTTVSLFCKSYIDDYGVKNRHLVFREKTIPKTLDTFLSDIWIQDWLRILDLSYTDCKDHHMLSISKLASLEVSNLLFLSFKNSVF